MQQADHGVLAREAVAAQMTTEMQVEGGRDMHSKNGRQGAVAAS